MRDKLYSAIALCFMAITALTMASFAHADIYSNDYYSNCNPCYDNCCPSNCCCTPVPPPACGEAYNAPAYLECCNPCCSDNLFLDSLRFRADFLWWRACVCCLPLGTEETSLTFPNGILGEKSKEKDFDHHYDPGFRIGLLSICPCDCFDVALNWTHFHTHASALGVSSSNTRGSNPRPPGVYRAATGEVTVLNPAANMEFVSDWQTDPTAIPNFSKGKWKFNLDLLDLEFGRKFYVSSCFIVRPNLGLRGARINQSIRVQAQAGAATQANPQLGSNSFISSTKARSNFLGIGPRIGLDLELTLPCTCGIKLFGQVAESLVFGRTERHSREDFDQVISGTRNPETIILYENKATLDRCSKVITDLLIGLKWEHCCTWCNRQHPVTLAISWEFHKFNNLNNFIFQQEEFTSKQSRRQDSFEAPQPPVVAGGLAAATMPANKKGSITTQGLTASLEVRF